MTSLSSLSSASSSSSKNGSSHRRRRIMDHQSDDNRQRAFTTNCDRSNNKEPIIGRKFSSSMLASIIISALVFNSPRNVDSVSFRLTHTNDAAYTDFELYSSSSLSDTTVILPFFHNDFDALGELRTSEEFSTATRRAKSRS